MIDKKINVQVEHVLLFGKGKRTPHQSVDTLTQGIVQALYMSRQINLLVHDLVRSFGQAMVGFPLIPVNIATQILIRNFMPQAPTGMLGAITNKERDELSGAATQHNPQAYFIDFEHNIGKQFIQFQNVSYSCEGNAAPKKREGPALFLTN